MVSGKDDGKTIYAGFDMVVLTASAGGIQALLPLVQNLPADLSAPILLVQHLPPVLRYLSKLPEVLQRHTSLHVKWAEGGHFLMPGTIYIAPQDRLTLFDARTGCLLVSQAEGRNTPTADPLFRSAARAFGSRTMAVVLSGALDDGADGAAAIARAGGRVLVQSTEEAEFADMPRAAMKRCQVGLTFDSATLASIIGSLVMVPGAADWFAIGKTGVGARLLAS